MCSLKRNLYKVFKIDKNIQTDNLLSLSGFHHLNILISWVCAHIFRSVSSLKQIVVYSMLLPFVEVKTCGFGAFVYYYYTCITFHFSTFLVLCLVKVVGTCVRLCLMVSVKISPGCQWVRRKDIGLLTLTTGRRDWVVFMLWGVDLRQRCLVRLCLFGSINNRVLFLASRPVSTGWSLCSLAFFHVINVRTRRQKVPDHWKHFIF